MTDSSSSSSAAVLVKRNGEVKPYPLDELVKNKAYIYLLQNPGKIASVCKKNKSCPGSYFCSFVHTIQDDENDQDSQRSKKFTLLRNNGETIQILSTKIVQNQAYKFLMKNPEKQGMECRGHPEGITNESCKYVHLLTQKQYDENEKEHQARVSQKNEQQREKKQKENDDDDDVSDDECPPPSSMCNICFDDDDDSDDENNKKSSSTKKSIICSKGHRTCADCLDRYLTEVYPKKTIDPGTIPQVVCLTKNCSTINTSSTRSKKNHEHFKAGDIARIVSPEAFDLYLQTFQRAVEAKALSDVSSRLKEIVLMNPTQALNAARDLEHLTIAKSLMNSDTVFMCPQCKYSPILLSGCDDLTTHHNQVSSSRKHTAAANNSCPGCGKLYRRSYQLMKWDGIVRKGFSKGEDGFSEKDDDDDDEEDKMNQF